MSESQSTVVHLVVSNEHEPKCQATEWPVVTRDILDVTCPACLRVFLREQMAIKAEVTIDIETALTLLRRLQ